MKQTLIIGNIITMDSKRSFAKAALVKDGVFAYIGDIEDVKKLAGADAKVLDYGENFIYPGFMARSIATSIIISSAPRCFWTA